MNYYKIFIIQLHLSKILINTPFYAISLSYPLHYFIILRPSNLKIISVDHEVHNQSLVSWSDKGDYHLLRFWSLPTLNLNSEHLVSNDISCFSRLVRYIYYYSYIYISTIKNLINFNYFYRYFTIYDINNNL